MIRSTRAHGLLLLVLTAAAAGHHLVHWLWMIEDAAISFAYAKHLAAGEGLVPFVGGERVEGYSNPAWVFALVPVFWVGLGPWIVEGVRFLQLAMCAATVPVVWLAGREAMGRDSVAPLVAAGLIAASAQFAVWGSAGLETGLLNLWMALAIWRSLVEIRTRAWPASALLWFGVALCRPEGVLYSAVAGFVAMVSALHAGRGLSPTLRWLLIFFLPFGAYHTVRYQYFAWEWPNTYYGKLERRGPPLLLQWTSPAWRYTRDFLSELGWGAYLPAWALGIAGNGRGRTALAWSAVLGIGVATQLAGDQRFLLPTVVGVAVIAALRSLGRQHTPRPALAVMAVGAALIAVTEALRAAGVPVARLPAPPGVRDSLVVPLLIGAGAALTVASVGARAWQARMLTFGLCLAAMVFALLAQWDWMNGFRWYAPATVPGALLLSMGVHALAEEARSALTPLGRPGTRVVQAVAVLLTLAAVPANALHTAKLARAPQTQPQHVYERVVHVTGLQRKLHIEERLVDLDVDQGAHLLWSDFEMLDVAGLIDIPLGHNKFDPRFLRDYVFTEKRPHFTHIHAQWERSMRLAALPEWKRDYIALPDYRMRSGAMHPGNYLRRDLVVSESRWPGPGQATALDGGIVLHGVRVPAAPAAGGAVHVEVGLSLTRPRPTPADDFRVALFAVRDGSVAAAWDVAPGYDWLTPHDWRPREVFRGVFDLPLPAALSPGTYDLATVVFGADGTVRAPSHIRVADPVVAQGEVLFLGALRILPASARDGLAKMHVDAALAAAGSGECAAAVRDWRIARQHHAGDHDWADARREAVHTALAGCHATAADTADRPGKIAHLIAAREYDHWHPGTRARVADLADALMAEGEAARQAGDHRTAYLCYRDAVRVDRTRSWARRYAEEARAAGGAGPPDDEQGSR